MPPISQNDFDAVAKQDLHRVQGGASRVTSRSGSGNDQLTTMMTQLTSSITQMQQNKGGMDPSMMMMMMMMGGGGGGGGGQPAVAQPVAPAAPAAPVINISTRVR